MEPSWQPDPTGRHHYRWWDGAAWTDAVADHGATSLDPLPRPAAASDAPAPVVAVSTTPTVTVSTTPRTNDPTAPSPHYAEILMPRRRLGVWITLAFLVLAGAGAAVYLLVFHDTATAERSTAGITSGELTGKDSFVYRDIRLKDGDAIRYRIEGDANRDLVTYLIAPRELATDFLRQFYTDYGTEPGINITDFDAYMSNLTDANDVFTDGTVQDFVLGYSVVQKSDRCCAGVPDTDTFVATVTGTYRIFVVEAEGRKSNVKIIVDRFDQELYAYDEITDALLNDDFFTDTGFFKDTEPYVDTGS
jgi:hypothetical protein